MTEPTALMNIGDLAKPATVLVERICDAIGGFFEPYQIRRVAHAEADADMIKAVAQIEITKVQRRAMRRFFAEEAKRQDNMESITRKAIPQLDENAQPEKLEEDWIMNFFDKCRLVSDEQMQDLWAKVLAGEANSPGKFSKRTVNSLSSLDKRDAILFTKLCGFAWYLDDVVPLVYSTEDSIYSQLGFPFHSLMHLDAIGLLSFEPLAGYRKTHLPKTVRVHYHGTPINIQFQNDQDNELAIGKVLLSQTGQELARVCGSEPIPGFLEYILDHWANKGLVLSSPYPRLN